MLAMRRRPMCIVEVKLERHSFVDSFFYLPRGGNSFEAELHGPECGGGDCEEECLLFRRARPNQQHFRATEMRQSETSKRKRLLQRTRWQMNAAQELSGRENIGMIASDKFNYRHVARLSIARPKCANAFQGRSEGNHRACRKRHADVPANRRFIPDFERRKERATTFAEERGRNPIGWRFFYEPIEFDNPASSS